MGATEAFADWICGTQYQGIPPKGIANVKRSILDWIGCAMVGSTRPAARIVTEHTQELGGTPQSRLLASGFRTTSANAAFANGVMGHLEDFDDSGAHPSSYLTPAVLALAEERHLSGKEVLTAWAIGHDISALIAMGLHSDRPWHGTSVLGSMGGTASASKLMSLDAGQIRMAFGIAASQTSGVMRNFGTMTKAFHPAHAAQCAVTSAKLAARGYTSDPDIIEGRYGYADCLGGEKCHVPSMTQFLGKISLIATKPPAIKAWPTCSGNHESLTAIFKLLKEQSISSDDIVRVEHYDDRVPGSGALHRREVHSGLDGKFCLEYNIAAAFVDGKVDMSTFSDERVARGDLQKFMKRVYLYQHPESALQSSRTRAASAFARMKIILKNETVHEVKLAPRHTLTGEAVVDKFRANAGSVLDNGRVEKVIQLVEHLDKMADTSELMGLLTKN